MSHMRRAQVTGCCIVFLSAAFALLVGIVEQRTAYGEERLSETFIAHDPRPSVKAALFTVSPDYKHSAYWVGNDRKWTIIIDGKEGRQYDAPGYITFSPDSTRLAYTGKKNELWEIIIDEKETGQYKHILPPVFSPDSKRVAYNVTEVIGKENNRIIVDGKAEKGYIALSFEKEGKRIKRTLVFSPDSRRLAYVVGFPYDVLDTSASKRPEAAHLLPPQFAVIDGLEGRKYTRVSLPVFSPNSKRVAYNVEKGISSLVVIDEVEQTTYKDTDHISFSPDSRRIAYVATTHYLFQKKRWFVVVDGIEGEKFDGVVYPIFSPDSKRVAYYSITGDKWAIVVDGKEEKQYDETHDLIFSPDSKRVGYTAKKNNKWAVVIDGKEQKQYDEISSLTFSPDSKHVAYVAKMGEKYAIIVDDQEGKEYDVVTSPIFSQSSRHVAYAARMNDKMTVVVDQKEQRQYNQILGSDSRVYFESPDTLRFFALQDKNFYAVRLNISEPIQSSVTPRVSEYERIPRGSGQAPDQRDTTPQVSVQAETALDILKKRYARGEITKEEFDRIKEDLK